MLIIAYAVNTMAAGHLGIQGARASEVTVLADSSGIFHLQCQNVEGQVKLITIKMQVIEIIFFHTIFVTRMKHDYLYKLYPPINLHFTLN